MGRRRLWDHMDARTEAINAISLRPKLAAIFTALLQCFLGLSEVLLYPTFGADTLRMEKIIELSPVLRQAHTIVFFVP